MTAYLLPYLPAHAYYPLLIYYPSRFPHVAIGSQIWQWIVLSPSFFPPSFVSFLESLVGLDLWKGPAEVFIQPAHILGHSNPIYPYPVSCAVKNVYAGVIGTGETRILRGVWGMEYACLVSRVGVGVLQLLLAAAAAAAAAAVTARTQPGQQRVFRSESCGPG
jgi:hypothetical protein